MQKGKFFVTGEVFLLDIGLLMGAKTLKTDFTHLTHASINFSDLLVAEVRSRNLQFA